MRLVDVVDPTRGQRRYIIVGDVHGCFDELVLLMSVISPRPDDIVISVGDLVDRGPHSDLCVEYWMNNRYLSVLGNHDARIVDWAFGKQVASGEDIDRTIRQVGNRPDLVNYLQSLPLAIFLPDINALVVHAAVNINKSQPEFTIAESDKEIVLRGRFVRRVGDTWEYLRLDHRCESEVLWVNHWTGPELIVYGHTPNFSGAVRQHQASSIGIDTASSIRAVINCCGIYCFQGLVVC